MEDVLNMFYISFSRNKPSKDNRGGTEVKYIGIPHRFANEDCYYQIYENGKPLLNMSFSDEKTARTRLKGLLEELKVASNGWYRLESRIPPYMPIRNVLGVRKIYGDGTPVDITYVVKKISMRPMNSEKNSN